MHEDAEWRWALKVVKGLRWERVCEEPLMWRARTPHGWIIKLGEQMHGEEGGVWFGAVTDRHPRAYHANMAEHCSIWMRRWHRIKGKERK